MSHGPEGSRLVSLVVALSLLVGARPLALGGCKGWGPGLPEAGRQQEGCLRLGRLRTPPPPAAVGTAGPCELAQEREEGCQEGTWQLPGPETWPVLCKDFLPGTGSGLMWCQAPLCPRTV